MVRDPYAVARRRMVEHHIAARGVANPRVLKVMAKVPRHLFVAEHLQTQAYSDFPLPIDREQTISQPYVVARMTELLDPGSEHSVLEIGTGSGYQTVVLAHLARRVYSLERIGLLARQAIERVRLFDLDNVKIQTFDGTVGWSDVAPFDRILVTAGAPSVPMPLLAQLAEGGKLVLPEGPHGAQELVVYEKIGDGVRRRSYQSVSFVPLIGRHGWSPEDVGEAPRSARDGKRPPRRTRRKKPSPSKSPAQGAAQGAAQGTGQSPPKPSPRAASETPVQARSATRPEAERVR